MQRLAPALMICALALSCSPDGTEYTPLHFPEEHTADITPLNRELVMDIPLHFANEELAPGIKDGGVLNIVHRSLEVSCSPDNIPEHLELDLSSLAMGEGLTTKDIVLPEGVKLVDDEEITVVTIAEPAKEEVEEAPAPAAAEEAPAADAPKAEEEGK